jgi:hypothetical protein
LAAAHPRKKTLTRVHSAAKRGNLRAALGKSWAMVLRWMFGGHFAGNVFSSGAAPGTLRQAGASPRNRCYEPAGSPAGGAGRVFGQGQSITTL